MPQLKNPPFRQQIGIYMRMTKQHVVELDKLALVNKRTRREIVETLIHEAAMELRSDPTARINP